MVLREGEGRTRHITVATSNCSNIGYGMGGVFQLTLRELRLEIMVSQSPSRRLQVWQSSIQHASRWCPLTDTA